MTNDDLTMFDGTGEEHDLVELLEESVLDERLTFPTTCPEGCEVEPDGHCPHGHPSLLVKAGLI